MLTEDHDRILLRARNIIISLALLVGVYGLMRFVFLRSWNYDELSHAHRAWLMMAGEVPYRDFATNHFPYFGLLVSGLLRVLPDSPAALVTLRMVTILCHCVALGSLGVIVASDLPVRQRFWVLGCMALMVFSPPALHFLVEFRPDPVANALLLAAIAWLKITPHRGGLPTFVCGFMMGTALLINTKYAIFPVLLGASAVALHFREIKHYVALAGTVLAGYLAAFLCGYALLFPLHIVPRDAWRMVIEYNALAEKAHSFGFGMARSVSEHPFLLAYIVAGIAYTGLLLMRNRRMPGVFDIAIFLFLAVSLMTNTRPWKQYYISWFLMASYFPARAFPALLCSISFEKQLGVACGLLLLITGEMIGADLADPNGGPAIARKSQDRLITWTMANIPAGSCVAAGFPLHPVFMKDTFFKTMMDMTADNEDGLELHMPALSDATYAMHFQPAGYVAELEARPPALIVLPALRTEGQTEALNSYLKARPKEYEFLKIPETDIVVLKRLPTPVHP